MPVVTFKHEHEENGEPVGPISIRERGAMIQLRPFNPEGEEVEWVTLSEARRRAKTLGLELEMT